jgi:hypothetical protein
MQITAGNPGGLRFNVNAILSKTWRARISGAGGKSLRLR